jgi:glycerol uptake facilitator-like aquaporin
MIKYLVEFIGTFMFLSVILSQGQALPIVIALAAAIFFGGSISGGHFNPAVSFMFHMNNGLPLEDFLFYVVSQLAGGFVALTFFKNFVEKVAAAK